MSIQATSQAFGWFHDRQKTSDAAPRETAATLRHWHETAPNDRLAHLVKDATRAMVRAMQLRLAEYAVS
jgi:hypothetical protein